MSSGRFFVVPIAAAVVLASLGAPGSARAGGAFPPLTEDGLPNVQSGSSLVLDMEDGTVLYEKDADKVRGIASTTKIFVAMVVRAHGLDLDARTEIQQVDAEYAKGGARTRLWTGHSFKNVDLMRAMLIASDNRAPTALARSVGLTPDELIEEMNRLARELGLVRTHFTDPSGLRGNESTAREMVIALQKALEDDLIAEILSTEKATVTSEHEERPKVINYGNTNKALHAGRYTVYGGKTGYTEAAGYCLIIAAEVDGRSLAMAFLGSHGKLTRYGDFNRVAGWVNDHLEEEGSESAGDSHAAAQE